MCHVSCSRAEHTPGARLFILFPQSASSHIAIWFMRFSVTRVVIPLLLIFPRKELVKWQKPRLARRVSSNTRNFARAVEGDEHVAACYQVKLQREESAFPNGGFGLGDF